VSRIDPLLDYLNQLARRGETHVRLDEDARKVLRAWYRAGKKKPVRSRGVASLGAGAIAVAREEPPAYKQLPRKVRADGETPAEQLASLQEQARQWDPARALGTLRDTMVFATGNPEADLMLVGEAPGYEEERRQEPFVGRAGQKLDQILTAMGSSRDEIYISNICKFRPALKNQTTNNRKPTREEMDACLPFVRAEIGVVKPKCIIALGATAAEGLLDRQEPVGRMRGAWHEFEGIPVRVTYHPSYLLHNDAAIGEKRKVWDDMLSVMEYLEMPISETQRGFFSEK
jgi:DNA polymerase